MTQKIVLASIEDPKGSTTHVELNETTQQYKVMHEFSIPWPFHYGFIKDTYVPVDGDPLDVAIFGDFQTRIGQDIHIQVIGALIVRDGDHKVIAVYPDDTQCGRYVEYIDLPENLRLDGENIFKKGGHVIKKVLNSEDAMRLIDLYRVLK